MGFSNFYIRVSCYISISVVVFIVLVPAFSHFRARTFRPNHTKHTKYKNRMDQKGRTLNNLTKKLLLFNFLLINKQINHLAMNFRGWVRSGTPNQGGGFLLPNVGKIPLLPLPDNLDFEARF